MEGSVVVARSKVGKKEAASKKPSGSRTNKKRAEVLPPIEGRVTFGIHRINALLARLCKPIFSRHGVDLVSSRILVILRERREVRVGDIVELMVLPQPTISRHVNRLEKQGFVTRTRLSTDNRSVCVTLRPKGAKVAAELDRLSGLIYSAITKNISPSELERMGAQLQFVFDELRGFDVGQLK